ncbi:MAG TPA: hydrogenase maturation protease [Thermoplasmata archaeon]|nr:hydrogenase maturation protease [Thermoplasmata archaeon]
MTSPATESAGTGGPLVIGVGNEVRGDDAAGLQVARDLRPLVGDRVRIVESLGGVAELLDLWDGRGRVYLIDAVRSGGAAGKWLRLRVGAEPLPSSLAGTSTHGLSIASAVALGQQLGRMPTHLVVYGIEAVRFDAGSPLSPEVLGAVRQVTVALADELGRVGTPTPVAVRRS